MMPESSSTDSEPVEPCKRKEETARVNFMSPRFEKKMYRRSSAIGCLHLINKADCVVRNAIFGDLFDWKRVNICQSLDECLASAHDAPMYGTGYVTIKLSSI